MKKNYIWFITWESLLRHRNSVFNILNPTGLKLLSRLRLGLSHLREHKYRHNFTDTNIPFCSCGMLEAEATEHFLLRCPCHLIHRNALLESKKFVLGIIIKIWYWTVRILLYGIEELDEKSNKKIIEATICFWEKTGRFYLTFYE